MSSWWRMYILISNYLESSVFLTLHSVAKMSWQLSVSSFFKPLNSCDIVNKGGKNDAVKDERGQTDTE